MQELRDRHLLSRVRNIDIERVWDKRIVVIMTIKTFKTNKSVLQRSIEETNTQAAQLTDEREKHTESCVD